MANTFEPRSIVQTIAEAIILSGATTSQEIDLFGYTLMGFHLPAAFTGTTLKIQTATVSGGTFQTAFDAVNNADFSFAIAAGKYVSIPDFANITAGMRFIKIVSGSAEGADRTITLAVRPV